MRRLPAALAIIAVIAAEVAVADQSEVVFGCNYTLSVAVDGEEFTVSHRDRVRNGSAIPFQLQNYLLHLRITSADDETAIVELVLSEKTGDGWHEIYPVPPSFTIRLGVPTEFRHADDIAVFDVFLIASKLER